MSDPATPTTPAAAPAATPATPAVAAAPDAPKAPEPATAKPRVLSPGRASFLERRAPVAAPPATPPSPPVAAAPEAPKPAAEPSRAKVPARLAREVETLRASAADAKADRDALATFAKSALADAPENVRAFIQDTVGDNPRAVLKALATAKAKGLLAAPGVPAGATTSHPPAPPAADPSDADIAAARKYRELEEAGKSRAANILYSLDAARIDRGLQKLARN